MGTSKLLLETGGFERYEYETAEVVNGIKIVRKKDGRESHSTPLYSNTPHTMYAKKHKDDQVVNQVAVYGAGSNGRKKLKDIDIGHNHTNKDKKKLAFGENDIHVHDYVDGVKSKIARKPSKKERRLLMLARNRR